MIGKPLTDFTLQDFQHLAERLPNLDGNWIYRLTRTLICEINDIMYPKFDIYEELPIWFLTLPEAESCVKEMVANVEGENKLSTYCFQIAQFPLGIPAEHGAQWLYDESGNLVDYSITTWSGDDISTTFFGRPENRNRFKRGDIVEVINGDEVSLAVLVENSPSVKWCWNLYKRCLRDYEDKGLPYFLDASDDCCYLIDGPGHDCHSHVSPLLIMKPRFTIPEAIEKEMKGWMKHLDQAWLKRLDENR